MKKSITAILLAACAICSHATCVGTGAFRSCVDSSGNSYTSQSIGSTTYTQGSNANTGSSWSQSSQQIGNTTFHNGTAANGNYWSGTTQRIGDFNFYNGTDSRGNPYSGSSYSPSDNDGADSDD